MKRLFLGTGRVTTAMAAVLPGEHRALSETGSGLEFFEWSSGAWKKENEYPGSLDDFDFSKIFFDEVILSPGIDPRRPFFSQVRLKEKRELDLFCERFKGRTFVITGTNGKSTATFQIGEIFKRTLGADRVFVGGNLGPASFEAFKEKQNFDWAILEVSSFQAERIKTAKFDLGLLLNLGIDHADRYGSLADYHGAKWHLLQNCKHVIYPKEYSFTQNSAIASFSEKTKSEAFYPELISLLQDIKIEGFLNPVRLDNLPRLPHRLEVIEAPRSKTHWINDSKATNVESCLFALESLESSLPKIHLLLGGKDKGDDFSRLRPWLPQLKSVWVYGQAREKIAEQIGSFVPVSEAASLKEACEKLKERVSVDEWVLLSPACASFDEFKNYEERGSFFRQFAQKFDQDF